ncbi:hypothetical protein K437DRAFT_72784 [Tilletiaria anomala UBC 951]|uniref:Uncharacterized protein n=1 Tax=Tilletiaria anomala (strain ATCC 24038 / CBS 436.72 / UBC 951) TaxID=1037660 RepID=A0A066WLL1_TILAU|nr:uncharacterized protein K437DRAFT_72784 [Tilletiaria anomala UBC 951]KDN53483.1 hypothetical protein K437DRAFT_72784 [Tilletiaria anomala UBC 951]
MSATTATSMHGKGAQLPHDGPLLHPLSVNPHLEQLALDSFEENMIPNAIGFLRRLMLNSVPPTVTMIQFIIAVALCSPKAAVKRTEEKARRLRTEKYRLELSAKPTPEDIVAALDLLHRIGDMYPGELITALPPYSPGGTGDDGQVPPNPASAYASFAIPRPTSRLDPEASFSSSELPIRMYVWDYLMTCRDIWSLADIKEEYWEINPTAAAERRKHKRKLRQQIPQSDPSSSKSRDLSGFWNVLSVVAPVWKAQHEFIRRNLRERGLAWRPPPAEVSKLSLVHQCFHSVLPRTRGWSAATDLKTMLDTLASGLKSSEFQRPIAGKALPSRKSVALSILQEVFFLCEIDLIDSSAILRWLGPQCGVEVVLDDDDNPIALGPDEGKVEPSTLTLENVKEIENLLRGMTSAWFPMLKGYQIFERSLSVAPRAR